MKISNWTTNVANQTYKDLDLPGFTRFVAKIYQLRITRFWGKILNSNFYLCKKFDISQLWEPGGMCRCVIHNSSQARQKNLSLGWGCRRCGLRGGKDRAVGSHLATHPPALLALLCSALLVAGTPCPCPCSAPWPCPTPTNLHPGLWVAKTRLAVMQTKTQLSKYDHQK